MKIANGKLREFGRSGDAIVAVKSHNLTASCLTATRTSPLLRIIHKKERKGKRICYTFALFE